MLESFCVMAVLAAGFQGRRMTMFARNTSVLKIMTYIFNK